MFAEIYSKIQALVHMGIRTILFAYWVHGRGEARFAANILATNWHVRQLSRESEELETEKNFDGVETYHPVPLEGVEDVTLWLDENQNQDDFADYNTVRGEFIPEEWDWYVFNSL